MGKLINTTTLTVDGVTDVGEWHVVEGEHDRASRCEVALPPGVQPLNLRLHLEHFPGQTATAMLPTATWAGPRDQTWATLTDTLGVPPAPSIGERMAISAPDAPALAGTVVDVSPWRLALLLDQPAPGTAFLAVEGSGEQVAVSIWSYLYGPDGAAIAERDEPLWQHWLTERALAKG